MYGIWWEKPFDVGNSVFIDAYGMGSNNFAAEEAQLRHNLEDTVMYLLKHFEEHPEPAKESGGQRSDDNGGKTNGEKGGEFQMTVSVNEDPGVTSPQFVAALAVFRSIDQAPKEAVKLFLPYTKIILDYCVKLTRKDFTTSIWQHHLASVKSCETDTGSKILMETPASEKIKIPEKVSHAAYKDAFDVAYDTASRMARETNSRIPIIKRLDELSLKTRQATFKSSYIAAFAAAVAVENQLDIDPTPTKLTTHKEASKISLAVTFRAAAAATRAASRHAVRLVALGIVLGHESAADAVADAAADALRKIAKENVRGPMASNDVFKEIEAGVKETREGARNAFRQRFQVLAVRPSKIADAAEILEFSTATGIYMAF
jgi:hypothetical protein